MKPLALVAAIYALTGSQSATPSVVGTWIAQLEGRTFVRLQLDGINGAVKGGITIGDIEFDKTGDVGKAEEPPRVLRPITVVAQKNGVVAFLVESSEDPDRFEFRMIDATRAELRLVLSEDQREELAEMGIPALKPIPLRKQ